MGLAPGQSLPAPPCNRAVSPESYAPARPRGAGSERELPPQVNTTGPRLSMKDEEFFTALKVRGRARRLAHLARATDS